MRSTYTRHVENSDYSFSTLKNTPKTNLHHPKLPEGNAITFDDTHNWRSTIHFFFFMCLEMLSCFCIFAPVINTRADLSITDWQIKAACQKGQGTCACLNRCQRRGCKRKARLICSPGLRGFKHINPIKGSDKPIPSSPLKMWVMRTLAAVYGMIIIYATT